MCQVYMIDTFKQKSPPTNQGKWVSSIVLSYLVSLAQILELLDLR